MSTSLDGKKIIFIGNSFVFYGNAVLRQPCTILSQKERTGNRGYFYQLCKCGGDEVEVTNWTFGGHTLAHIYKNECGCVKKECYGKDHSSFLLDRYFDYVVISGSSGDPSDKSFLEDIENLKKIFTEANPNVKLVYLSNLAPYGISTPGTPQPNILKNLKTLDASGIPVADWGSLVYKIMTGKTTVPGAKETYTKNTFIVSRTEKDGFHENALSGYITSLMLYCLLTGKSAVGQPYSFWCDGSVSEEFDPEVYKRKYYCLEGATTNYTDVFDSPCDMLGLQELIDKELREKPFLSF